MSATADLSDCTPLPRPAIYDLTASGHTIPYHLDRHGLDLPWLMLRPINCGPLHMLYRNGKESWGVYPGVGGALLLPLFAGSACV